MSRFGDEEGTPIFHGAVMQDVIAAAEDVALANTTVLISGESGTGKEILSRYIHRCSPRANGPWVAINCAALPGELLEGELFGHERGAFTGAVERRLGRIEQADRGTLLLDEISELPLLLQAKLLRVLQEREVDRVGGRRPVPVDVRIIATSNRSLSEMVARREFRADLFYRLNVFPIELPPLRERVEDIPILAQELLRAASHAMGKRTPVLGDEALRALEQYAFPGNVRELSNILERALVRCRDSVLNGRDLDLPYHGAAPGEQTPSLSAPSLSAPSVSQEDNSSFPRGLPLDLAELERLAIAEALRLDGGNRTHAARRLGISIRTLRNKLNLHRQMGVHVHEPTAVTDADTATSADGKVLPGKFGPVEVRARSATLARASQLSEVTREER